MGIFMLKLCSLSNNKRMTIATDRWHTTMKGPSIAIRESVVEHTATNTWNSVYGQVVCTAPYTYHWRFKIKAFAVYFMFGVAKVSAGDALKSSYVGNGENAYYAAYNNAETAYVYDKTGGCRQGQYGMERFNKNGCTLDMYLDLKQYQLSFKTGGEDTGVVIKNLKQEDYRMVIAMYNKQQIELVAFDYHHDSLKYRLTNSTMSAIELSTNDRTRKK